MVTVRDRHVILQRRLAFVSGALAILPGCRDQTSRPPSTVEVPVEPRPVASGTQTAEPPTTPPPKAAMPPRPATAIPETSCEPDRQVLVRMKTSLDQMYDEVEAIYRELPQSCPVVEDRCAPEHQPLAKRLSALQDRLDGLLGMCGCLAPIVSDYVGEHRSALRQRLGRVRDRIVELAGGAPAAGERWELLVRNETTPRPCLSCRRCEPKSACD